MAECAALFRPTQVMGLSSAFLTLAYLALGLCAIGAAFGGARYGRHQFAPAWRNALRFPPYADDGFIASY